MCVFWSACFQQGYRPLLTKPAGPGEVEAVWVTQINTLTNWQSLLSSILFPQFWLPPSTCPCCVSGRKTVLEFIRLS